MKINLKKILSVILFIILFFFILGDGSKNNNTPDIIGDDVNDLVETVFTATL
jgi:hypothetical protein